jgi:hypothetical protein
MVVANDERWPEAEEWQSTETTLKLDDWRREDRIYTAERAKQLARVQAERRQALAPISIPFWQAAWCRR